MVEALFLRVINASDVADKFAIVEGLWLSGSINLIPVQSAAKEEERTGGDLICVERAVVDG